jgi:hypothetical protein
VAPPAYCRTVDSDGQSTFLTRPSRAPTSAIARDPGAQLLEAGHFALGTAADAIAGRFRPSCKGRPRAGLRRLFEPLWCAC